MKLIICIFFLTLSVTGFAQPVIEFDTTFIDLDTVYSQDYPKAIFRFTNIGNEPLSIKVVKGSFPCSWPSTPIKPRKTGKIICRCEKNRLGPIKTYATVYSNSDTLSEQKVRIKGYMWRKNMEFPKPNFTEHEKPIQKPIKKTKPSAISPLIKVKIPCDSIPSNTYSLVPKHSKGKVPCNGKVSQYPIDGIMKDCSLWEGKYYNFDKDGILDRIDIYERGLWKSCQSWNGDSLEVSSGFDQIRIQTEIKQKYIGRLYQQTGDHISTGCGPFYIKTNNKEIIWVSSRKLSIKEFVGKKIKVVGTSFKPAEGNGTCISISEIKEYP
jgi:hypothetical protein